MAQNTVRMLISILPSFKYGNVLPTLSFFFCWMEKKQKQNQFLKNLQNVLWIRNYLLRMYCMLLNKLLTCLFCGLLNDE